MSVSFAQLRVGAGATHSPPVTGVTGGRNPSQLPTTGAHTAASVESIARTAAVAAD